tara:strand:+ start:1652 stop:2677 length:1026 start_codon:yes stop_codon:yes gene_type:complete
MKKKDIRDLSIEELEEFFLSHKIKKFRLNQLNNWIWKKGSTSFNVMTSLSKNIRNLLNEHFTINTISIDKKLKSIDGTIKYSFILQDKNLIEGVLIPSRDRVTACISSQAGCSLSCSFCATGTLKLKRNLTYYEIYDQVYLLNEQCKKYFNKPLSNIVYMGMGEPLLNYNNVLNSIEKITSCEGMGISNQRITLSTVGLPKMIIKLADKEVRFNLAVSLHSAINKTRSKIMSINDSQDLLKLKQSISYFYEKTKTRITYEYILLEGVNDDLNSAKKLADFCKISPCKINLIEYNIVKGSSFKKSSNTKQFMSFLRNKNLIVNLRKSKGEDINAACGQLINN